MGTKTSTRNSEKDRTRTKIWNSHRKSRTGTEKGNSQLEQVKQLELETGTVDKNQDLDKELEENRPMELEHRGNIDGALEHRGRTAKVERDLHFAARSEALGAQLFLAAAQRLLLLGVQPPVAVGVEVVGLVVDDPRPLLAARRWRRREKKTMHVSFFLFFFHLWTLGLSDWLNY